MLINILTHEIIIQAIKKYLFNKGWNYKFISKRLREHGADIVVRDGNNKHKARYLFIECKSRSTAKSAKSITQTDPIFALGQLITRMNVIAKDAYLYGLGLPVEYANTALRRIPWQIASYLSLRIYSVNDNLKVTEYKPRDIKRLQNQ